MGIGFIRLPVYPRLRWALFFLALVLLVLLPFLFYGERITAWTMQLLDSRASRAAAAIALGGLLALDIVLPLPSSAVSTAAGALLGLWPGALVSWTGMTTGCVAGYAAGARAAGSARRLVGSEELKRVSQSAARHGDWMVILFRSVPVLAEASVIFAGITRIPFGRFLILSALSNAGISLAYAAVGAFSVRMESFFLAFAGAILAPLAGMLALRRAR